jgi:DNA invertase Pin-like site-specific DNA recombinase
MALTVVPGGGFAEDFEGVSALHVAEPPPDWDLGLAAEWADVAYTRISDDRTGVAASPARQRREIKAAAADDGRAIGHWFEDLSKSAYKPGVVRSGFEALLEACQRYPVRRLWVLHDDRLIRDGDDTDLPRLIRALAPRRILVRCVEADDLKLWTAESKMSARVRNAVNVYESERKKERVELAAKDRARKGRFSGGGRRFGYTHRDTRVARQMDDAGNIHEEERPCGPLVLVPGEAEAIAAGYAAIMAGGSLRGICADWRARGLTGPQGAPWTPIAVRHVLLRAANAGLSVYRGEILGKADWPPIVDPDTYAAVKAILTAPERRTNEGRGRPAAHLLSGILICWACGEPMFTSQSGGSPKYRCKSGRQRPDSAPAGSRHATRVRAPLDAAVTELVIARIKSRGALPRPPRNPSGAVAAALAEASRLRGQIEGYQARAGEFDPDDLAPILRGLRGRLEAATAKIRAEAGTPVSDALGAATDIYAAWNDLDVAGRRAAIREQVEGFTVGPGLPGSRGAPMHNVTPTWREG